MFFLFSLIIHKNEIPASFGFREFGNFISFIVFLYLYDPVSKLSSLFQHYLTRVCEFQADSYARDLGFKDNLIRALVRLTLKNKGNLNPDSLYAMYYFTHPELIE